MQAPADEMPANPPEPLLRTDAAPEEIRLAKKVAVWLGTGLPPVPALGRWHPFGPREEYLKRTPARLGVGRAGPRYRTGTLLAFLHDHAAARDAVASALDPAMISQLGLVQLRSAAADKKEFLRRPDLGRKLDAESAGLVTSRGMKSPQVQIVAGDGLSATAINVNLPLVLPVLIEEFRKAGARVGTVFAISNSRVACADEVARLLQPDVLCMLVGERPGLKTAESMGAYVTYFKVKGFNESMRSVVSNIHRGGLVPGEGARQVAALCLKALRERRTGVDVSA